MASGPAREHSRCRSGVLLEPQHTPGNGELHVDCLPISAPVLVPCDLSS